MNEFATLIMGPSGTGKELVARAIALSRYAPFDAARVTFEFDPVDAFHAINIAALPATLIESELFVTAAGRLRVLSTTGGAGWKRVPRSAPFF